MRNQLLLMNMGLVKKLTIPPPLLILMKTIVYQVSCYKRILRISRRSLSDLLMNSPFGFIFKNKYMTIVFTACLVIMAAPYILQVVSPEFAAELNQIQTQTAKERLGEKLSSHLNLQLNLQVSTNLKVLKRDDSQ